VAISDFFERQSQALDGPRHGGHTDLHAGRARPDPTVFGQCGVGVRLHLRPQRRFVLHPDLPVPSGARFGSHASRLTPLLPPAADRPIRNAEGAGGLRLPQPGVQGPQQALAKVGRILLHLHSVSCG
jgi:hypothetical protein